MANFEFPDVDTADEDGLLALGGDLEPESLLLAYRSGIFPWPVDNVLAWWAPPERGVVFLDELHISRSLARELKTARYETKIDGAFAEVITRCAEVVNRGDQGGTWITPYLRKAYIEFAKLGYARSFESYFNGELVGGLYGVMIDNFFVAESSFYRMPNASKVAFVAMTSHLKSLGIKWFDCQMVTPFSKSFGARSIPRAEFMRLLAESRASANT
ncbi:MAG: leucyl/phenylalanyl-tRNA--protein transferase [Pseudomonadota bacterium]|jgi:leucyl/phenylalanyl-tRNA--protein transferase